VKPGRIPCKRINVLQNLKINIHTYHSRFIPEGVAEVSQGDTKFYQYYLAMSNTVDVTGGKPSTSDRSLSQV
jgi:hypothetical protein